MQMKFIRWSGLIGLAVFSALILVVGFFFINGWAKQGLEAGGTQANGAEVDVASVRLSLSPLGFTINDVEIADSGKPTHNAAVLPKVQVELSLSQLFLGNLRVHNLVISDVEADVERKQVARIPDTGTLTDSSGSSANTDVTEQSPSLTENLAQSLPSADSVLEGVSQNTQAAVSDAATVLAQSKAELASAVSEVPDESALSDYKSQIDTLEATELSSLDDVAEFRERLQSLKSSLEQDQAAVEALKTVVSQAANDNADALTKVANAPEADWQEVLETYPLNESGLLQVADLLLGEGVWQKLEKAFYWYNKAKPWLARVRLDQEEDEKPARGEGIFVHFPHPDPTARFQLDTGLISFVADGWPWELLVENVRSTTEGAVQPVYLKLRRGDENNEALLINGVLERVGEQSIDTFTVLGRGVEFNSREIEVAGARLNWVPENADVAGEIISENGKLDGEVTVSFPANEFSVSGSGDVAGYLQSAFQSVSAFDISIQLSGEIDSPRIAVSSDLDNKLGSALRDIAEEEYQAWLATLENQFNEKITDLTADLDGPLADFTGEESLANLRVENFEQQVESRIEALEDKLTAKQNELENKVKSAAEDKAKEEAEKLIDKFKF
jgi:uncharacterized protein (TIGR03545 family)